MTATSVASGAVPLRVGVRSAVELFCVGEVIVTAGGVVSMVKELDFSYCPPRPPWSEQKGITRDSFYLPGEGAAPASAARRR